MSILLFGGSFNPPHRGHVDALRVACDYLKPTRVLVIPGNLPPHKSVAEGSPDAAARLELTRLAFASIPEAEISDMELRRGGVSYTVDTLTELCAAYPGEEPYLLIGTDMFLSFEKWYRFERILELAVPAVIPRNDGEERDIRAFAATLAQSYGARSVVIPRPVKLPMSSTDLRGELRERRGREELPESVYAEIIRRRYYGAKPELAWLRREAYAYLKPSRVAHVAGCEETAVALARRWGEDEGSAAECAILHDITKKFAEAEQLRLCNEYGIMTDAVERQNPRLLHDKTGAALARSLFGIDDAVYYALAWHTTGRPAMTRLDKILYLADRTEPNRNYEGVARLRELAFDELDAAMIYGLELSLAVVASRGGELHPATAAALKWLLEHRKEVL